VLFFAFNVPSPVASSSRLDQHGEYRNCLCPMQLFSIKTNNVERRRSSAAAAVVATTTTLFGVFYWKRTYSRAAAAATERTSRCYDDCQSLRARSHSTNFVPCPRDFVLLFATDLGYDGVGSYKSFSVWLIFVDVSDESYTYSSEVSTVETVFVRIDYVHNCFILLCRMFIVHCIQYCILSNDKQENKCYNKTL